MAPIKLGGSDGGGIRLSFWGLVGATMVALKLKEHYDDNYRTVPDDPATNPLAPPSYRDDDGDAESAIALDTSLPTRARTKRNRRSCVCCGLNCTLFCKALGIVILIFTVWNAFKLVKWALTPSPTGLEGMPEYSNSLGCLDAKHFFQGSSQGTFYTIPPSNNGVDHELYIEGGAVGTLTIAPSSTAADTTIKVLARISSSDEPLLSKLRVATPGSSVPRPRVVKSDSYFALMTPDKSGLVAGTCMRYDLTVYLPPTLRGLTITSRSLSQIKFSDDFSADPRELGLLNVRLADVDDRNMVLPTDRLAADNSVIELSGGYLVGEVALANSTEVKTSFSSTITKLTVKTTAYNIQSPNEQPSERGSTAYLNTVTGSGRTDFIFQNPLGRPIRSDHAARGSSDMYLTYKEASFNGKVELDARSYTATGLQSEGRLSDPKARWAGNKDGGDFLRVKTLGWAGLYF